MLDVKNMLEVGTGLKVAETCFTKAQQLPYIVFQDFMEENGADYKNNIVERNITIELYSEKISKEKEMIIENKN